MFNSNNILYIHFEIIICISTLKSSINSRLLFPLHISIVENSITLGGFLWKPRTHQNVNKTGRFPIQTPRMTLIKCLFATK